MKLALVNNSQDLSILPQVMTAIAQALEHQLTMHYEPVWQSYGAQVLVYPSLDAIPNDGETAAIVIWDTPNDQALGWHDVLDNGIGSGAIFWDPIRKAGGSLLQGPVSLSAVISHEALEMMGDPYINWWAEMPDGGLEAIEICDRVESDHYDVLGVAMSNFLGPRAFRSGVGPYDYMRTLTSPWDLRPGGYVIRKMPDGTVYNLWGDEVPAWRREMIATTGRFARKSVDRSVLGTVPVLSLT